MNYGRFLLFEMVAAFLWNAVYCLIGYGVGMELDHLQLLFERSGWVILGMLTSLFLIWRLLRQRMKQHLRMSYRQRHTTSRPVANVGMLKRGSDR